MSTGELVKQEPKQVETRTNIGDANDPTACLTNPAMYNHLWKVATSYSRSKLVPEIYQGKPDDCFVACQLAIRLQADPFAVMQHVYVVHGKPGIEAQFAIALANSRGVFRDRIRWKISGEGLDRSCTAYAHDRQTGDVLEQTVTMRIAKAEGWLDKAGSKWKTMPDMMLQYRSAAWLIRTTCPEVLTGLRTTDEARDVIDVDSLPMGEAPSIDLLSGPKTAEPAKSEPQDSPAETVPEEFRDQDQIIGDYSACLDQSETVEDVDRWVASINAEPGTTTRTVGIVLTAAKKRREQLAK